MPERLVRPHRDGWPAFVIPDDRAGLIIGLLSLYVPEVRLS
jgi:hypothetical protein